MLGALYLPHAYFAALFISENLFVPVFVLGVWLAIRFLRSGSGVTGILAGLVLGYASLTRPFTLLMLPIVLMVMGTGLAARRARFLRGRCRRSRSPSWRFWHRGPFVIILSSTALS